jgi:hypothetical protein
MTWEQKYLARLDEAIKFHRENENDPCGVSNAVICALIGVRNAFAEATGHPTICQTVEKV